MSQTSSPQATPSKAAPQIGKASGFHRFANPAKFLRLANLLYPWLLAIVAILLASGLYLALFVAPPDFRQGDTVRIMFIHVPAAWSAMFVYANMAIASAVLLIWRHPLAGIAAQASAPIGAIFTLLALFTGSLWGKPMWGTWWVWDARLTSFLILFFIYLGYIALANAFENPERGQRAAGVLALVGAVNLPIIKFSVDWWNTLHQPASVMRASGVAIKGGGLQLPLGIMALAFTLLYIVILLDRMRSQLMVARVRAMTRSALDSAR